MCPGLEPRRPGAGAHHGGHRLRSPGAGRARAFHSPRERLMRFWPAAPLLLLLVAPAAHAKKFRYASGPRPPADTTLSVGTVEITPVVRERGPRVAATNLQLASLVANLAVERAMKSAPLDSGTHVVLAPGESHPL